MKDLVLVTYEHTGEDGNRTTTTYKCHTPEQVQRVCELIEHHKAHGFNLVGINKINAN